MWGRGLHCHSTKLYTYGNQYRFALFTTGNFDSSVTKLMDTINVQKEWGKNFRGVCVVNNLNGSEFFHFFHPGFYSSISFFLGSLVGFGAFLMCSHPFFDIA